MLFESLEPRRLLSSVVGAKIPVAATKALEGSYSVAFDGTNFLVAIERNHVISAQLITPAGAAAAKFTSTGHQGEHTSAAFGGQAMAAFGGGKYLLVWGDSFAGTHDIWGCFVATNGNLSGFPFPISQGNTEEETAGIASDGTNFMVCYLTNAENNGHNTIVAARTVSSTGVVGSEIRVSTGTGDQCLGNLAYGGGNYFADWVDDTNLTEVRGRFISKTGVPGNEISIDASSQLSDTPVAVAFNGSEFLAAWSDQTGPDAANYDLYCRLIDTGGGFLSNRSPVSVAAGKQVVPNIAFDGTNWLVTWSDFRNDTNGDFAFESGEGTFVDIYGQFINTVGDRFGPEFVVNQDAGWQMGGALAFGAGKYMTVWNDGTVLDVNGAFDFDTVYTAPIAPTPSASQDVNGILYVNGTSGPDSITLTHKNAQTILDYGNGITQSFSTASTHGISISAREGNDLIIISGAWDNVRADGQDGDDKIIGGDGNETLIGGANKDTLFGGGGNDRLNGNGGNDRLFGEAGADRLYGYDGNDILDGGSSSDRLEGGGGSDVMYGQSGNDKFFAQDGAVDQLFGGTGTDVALHDQDDILAALEG